MKYFLLQLKKDQRGRRYNTESTKKIIRSLQKTTGGRKDMNILEKEILFSED